MAENQGRSVPQSRQGVGHDKGFAGSGDSFQDGEFVSLLDVFDQFVNGLGLIASRRVGGGDLEQWIGCWKSV